MATVDAQFQAEMTGFSEYQGLQELRQATLVMAALRRIRRMRRISQALVPWKGRSFKQSKVWIEGVSDPRNQSLTNLSQNLPTKVVVHWRVPNGKMWTGEV